ncbi:MAG: oligosaccharide flippase family protein [Proteobacteria bacterium]|jgi:O-antigen/teichoic acid export membrane protein|nr:oligosaccharide flippase family protein [Desulfocapsa sp.]MBU3946023.1 oligosaccharide flippase family protein [Pseudomonadota bacterium]MCG2742857.1 oligosaccharide flippase family protein [Desulfobacteraceae bacterium]MBU4030172.1 oligosaccharide flippase family protein [Pseudomonadota bacterium]MBU4043796.1 oligosaccharide flippase family protein [Pseudomonadota bacterium]
MSILSILQKNENNFFSFGATVCRAFSRFLLVFIASLLLSKYEFGIFNIFLSIYFFSRLFSENSLNLPFIKFASDGENKAEVVNFQMILLKIFYVLIVSFVILVCSDFIVEYSGVERKRLLLFLPFMLFTLTAYMYVGQVLISQIKMRLLFFYELLSSLVFILFLTVAYFVVGSFSTEKLIIIFSLATGSAALAGVLVFHRFIKLTPRIDKELLWKIVHYSKFTVLSGISSLVILKVDVLMLGYFCSPKEVGVYGMALFVNEAVNVVFDSVLRVCLPQVSVLSGVNDENRIRMIFRQSVKDMYIGIIPIVSIIAVAAPTAIHLIYKGKYDDSILLIYIFLASSLVKPVGYVAGVILGATGNIRFDNRNCWISALLNLVCNYLLIPKFGVMGSAVASTLSFISLTILHYVSLQKTVFYIKQ